MAPRVFFIISILNRQAITLIVYLVPLVNKIGRLRNLVALMTLYSKIQSGVEFLSLLSKPGRLVYKSYVSTDTHVTTQSCDVGAIGRDGSAIGDIGKQLVFCLNRYFIYYIVVCHA